MTRPLRYSINDHNLTLANCFYNSNQLFHDASDPLTQANIYLYPKPHKVSDLVLKNSYRPDCDTQ